MTITLHQHKHFKYLHEALLEYINTNYAGKPVPYDLYKYNEYLFSQYRHEVKSILDWNAKDVCDADDFRYPNQEFLISLSETPMWLSKQKYMQIMELVCSAWYCFGDRDYVNPDFISFYGDNGYTLYTGGWSGNEDIIRALQMNKSFAPFLMIEKDRKCPAILHISYREEYSAIRLIPL